METAFLPPLDRFVGMAGPGVVVPVYTELTADYETPLSAFQKISDGRHAFLLESAENTEQAGRYSFLGSGPKLEIEARGREVRVTEGGVVREFTCQGDPLQELETVMARYRPAPGSGFPELDFHGGAVGFLAYDAVRYFEPTVPPPPPDPLGLPDLYFMIAETVVVFDHRSRLIRVVTNVRSDDFPDPASAYAAACRSIEEVIAKLERPAHHSPMRATGLADTGGTLPAGVRSNTSREEYCAMVAKAKDYIHAGDIFQVVPSQRYETDFEGEPVDLFRALRHINPSPYMFLLQCPGYALVGSSPEVHVRCHRGRVQIRPIAGTRWRGATPEEDLALEAELLADPKERAEHIMLVDLARNDVGRVAEFASVVVDDLMVIERYSHVMHIVSNVTGHLRPGRSAFDVMRATFPAGTVSGSPKVRAMQVINELEKHKRCAYAGAVGYFGFDGDHDSCIALRTCVVKDGKVYVQAGAGVVADSVPESEYQETVNKAQGMLRAVQRARALDAGARASTQPRGGGGGG